MRGWQGREKMEDKAQEIITLGKINQGYFFNECITYGALILVYSDISYMRELTPTPTNYIQLEIPNWRGGKFKLISYVAKAINSLRHNLCFHL